MDEHHWMTSHACTMVVGCNLLIQMQEGAMIGTCILFGFMSSHLGFVGAIRTFHVWANSHLLANLANVDGWLLKVVLQAHTHSCATQVRPYQTSTFLISIFCSFGRWVGFEVLISCCDFSHFWGSIMDAKERSAVSRRRSCERLEVLGSSEVVGRKPSLQLLLSSNCFHFAYFNTNPKLIRPCECDEGNTFVKLVPLLEGCSSCRLALLIL